MYVTLQRTARTVTWWNYDPKVRPAEIYDVQSSENNKILRAGKMVHVTWRYAQLWPILAFSKAVELA